MFRITFAAVWLALVPTVALAANGPHVEGAALEAIPPADRDVFATRAEELAKMDEEIATAQAQLTEAEATIAANKTAKADATTAAGVAKEDVGSTKEMAKHQVEVARLQYDEADHTYDASEIAVGTSKQELKVAKSKGDKAEISKAKSAVSAAKNDAAAKKQAREVAWDAYEQAKVDAGVLVEDSKEAADAAAVAQSEAGDDIGRAKLMVAVAEAKIEVLQARRNLASAELELDRAKSASMAGATIEVAPFETAAGSARADLASAEGHLVAAEAEAKAAGAGVAEADALPPSE